MVITCLSLLGFAWMFYAIKQQIPPENPEVVASRIRHGKFIV